MSAKPLSREEREKIVREMLVYGEGTDNRWEATVQAAEERSERLRSAAAWFLNELDEGQMPDAGNLRAAIDDYDAARGEG